MQESATMRSSPSPTRSPTARAHEAASSSFDQFDDQLALAHEVALPVDAGAADDQRGDIQEVSLDSDEESKSLSL